MVAYSLTIYLSRENVVCLIFHVPDASHHVFSTYENTEQFYLEAKAEGRVRLVRDPGDDIKFGPREDGIQ
jgi:hypothetical protein